MSPHTAKRALFSPTTLRRSVVSVLIMLLLGLTTVFGLSGAAHAEETDEVEGLSFYSVSASLMDLFSTAQQPDDDSVEWSDAGWDTILQNPGSAGSFLGYSDSDKSWITSQLSASSNTMDYGALNIRLTDENGNSSEPASQGFQEFALFGATLNGMGLDGTSTGLSSNITSWIGGGIMLLLFLLTYAVDFLFRAVLSTLSFLNPFRFFDEAIRETVGGQYTTGADELPGFLSGLSSWIADWYGFLDAMAWQTMVPMFIALFLVGIVFFKKLDKGSALKKLLIRLLFMGLGLPLLGSMFTATLDTMNEGFSAGRTGGTQVIASTYVDFEGWAKNGRLAVPAQGAIVEWDVSEGRPSGDSLRNARDTALAINNQTHNFDLERVVGSDDPAAWSQAAIDSNDANVDEAGFGTITDMLQRHMSGAQITASAYETGTKSWWSDRMDSPETVVEWFRNITAGSYTTSPIDGLFQNMAQRAQFWSESGGTFNAEVLAGNPVVSVGEKATGLQTSEDGDGVLAFRTDQGNIASITNCGMSYGSNLGAPANCNMSSLAMYNYLNTGFGESELTLYGSGNVMSEATREMHTSVNLVGTGTMSLLYWLNATFLLAAFVVLGFVFAFAMVFTTLKRSFQIIAAIPFATLGALHGIAKVVIYSVAAILEILLTIFLYVFIIEMLLSLPQIIEAPLSGILNDDGEGAVIAGLAGFLAFITGGPAFTMIVTFISIVSLLAFTVTALRTRKAVIKAADEAVTKLVEKFMDVDSTPATAGPGSGMGHGVASGVGAGMSATAHNRIRRGGHPTTNSNVSGTNSDAPGSNGPGDITTGPSMGRNGGGMGGGRRALGPGDTPALSGGRGGSSGPDHQGGPGDPQGRYGTATMGYASDEQSFGEKVRASGLSIDGRGYGPENLNGTNGARSEKGATGDRARPEALHSQTQSTRSADASTTTEAQARVATTETSGRANGTEQSSRRLAVSDETGRPHTEAQRQEKSRQSHSNEQNIARGNDVVAAGERRGATNLGGTSSKLSERERMEAQTALERTSAETAGTTTRPQRELQPGERQNHTSSQSMTTDQAGDSSTESARAELDASRARDEGAVSVQNQKTDPRPITGSSIENSAHETVTKQQGGEQKVTQDNRADQKRFEEQKVEQDNSSEQNTESRPVASEDRSVQGIRERTTANTMGTTPDMSTGITSTETPRRADVHQGPSTSKRKTSAPSASTPTKPKPRPAAPSTIETAGQNPGSGAVNTPSRKAPSPTSINSAAPKNPTRGVQPRKGSLSATTRGGIRGAALGHTKASPTSISRGLASTATGTAREAITGGLRSTPPKQEARTAQAPKKVGAPTTPPMRPSTTRTRTVSARPAAQRGQAPKGIKRSLSAAAASQKSAPQKRISVIDSSTRQGGELHPRGISKRDPQQ
ncbi:hypothetical protein [Nesterenkonia halotolerans]|uniref:MFS transporter n=1 Tax=Nesterenkonia halotolerans TaxID=225325 RepID=A0ABR9J5N6_9MICC|nr:hypothetical protein [Nesterenkonia halotolerans]MBE1514305.1 hypothetical protein [Nesterenkonia halotolerans]